MTNSIPDFVERDPDIVMSECKALLKETLGREIEPAQVEQLILNAFVYREILLVNRFNAGLSQLLYQFSTAPMLDYIASLVAVERLPAAKAGCTVRFTLVEGHGLVAISRGTRIASSDGNAIFETTEARIIGASTNEIEMYVLAQSAGKDHNDYEPGTINKILDPYAWISSAENLDLTTGGADPETDEQLRERIKLAPSQFSSAGSRQSYLFYAKSAHVYIKDVSVSSPVPGIVLIVPLTENKELEETVIEEIYKTCNAEDVRPLTDTVIVIGPENIDYKIDVSLTIYENTEVEAIKKEVETALNEFAAAKRDKLGQDIILSHISQICRIDRRVYDVKIVSPSANMIVENYEYASCEGITVNITDFYAG